jgi:SAM-dependent methyltransferase
MRYSRFTAFLPAFLRGHILHFEAEIDRAVGRFAASLPAGARVLDAGAGEARHRSAFAGFRYWGVDLAIGDATWDYGGLDALADLCALPFPDATFDAAIHIVTLEHLAEPARALAELARVLVPGGRVLLVAPQDWEIHQAPHDYFRYTRYGLAHLLAQAGLEPLSVDAVGGYFRLLSRRLLNGLQFFSGGARWLAFPLAGLLLAPPALLLPALDPLDRERNFTLGYVCTAQKRL